MSVVRNVAFSIGLCAVASHVACTEHRAPSQPSQDGSSAGGDASVVVAAPVAPPVGSALVAMPAAPASTPAIKKDAEGPLRKRALLGPRPSIEAVCKDVLLAGLTPPQAADASCGDFVTMTERTTPRNPAVLAAPVGPIKSARVLERKDANGSYCALAIETASGWFVDASHDLGTVMCSNVGTERVEVHVEELSARLEGQGSAVLSLAFTQESAHQGDDIAVAITTNVFCRVEGSGAPVCGELNTAQSKRALQSQKVDYEWSLKTTWRPDGAFDVREGPSKGKVPRESRTYIEAVKKVHRL